MAGLNKVILIGYLGKDPEIRYTPAGVAVGNISLATTEKWVDKNTGQKQEKTEWHRLVVFGKQAENCEKYLTKGSMIYVEGKLQTRSWDKEGQTHYTTEVITSTVQFLGGGDPQQSQGGGYQSGRNSGSSGGGRNGMERGGNRDNGYQTPHNPKPQGGSIPDDDIPF